MVSSDELKALLDPDFGWVIRYKDFILGKYETEEEAERDKDSELIKTKMEYIDRGELYLTPEQLENWREMLTNYYGVSEEVLTDTYIRRFAFLMQQKINEYIETLEDEGVE